MNNQYKARPDNQSLPYEVVQTLLYAVKQVHMLTYMSLCTQAHKLYAGVFCTSRNVPYGQTLSLSTNVLGLQSDKLIGREGAVSRQINEEGTSNGCQVGVDTVVQHVRQLPHQLLQARQPLPHAC